MSVRCNLYIWFKMPTEQTFLPELPEPPANGPRRVLLDIRVTRVQENIFRARIIHECRFIRPCWLDAVAVSSSGKTDSVTLIECHIKYVYIMYNIQGSGEQRSSWTFLTEITKSNYYIYGVLANTIPLRFVCFIVQDIRHTFTFREDTCVAYTTNYYQQVLGKKFFFSNLNSVQFLRTLIVVFLDLNSTKFI